MGSERVEQQNGKKEKTEFMDKIAEQVPRNATVSSSDEMDEMPGKQRVDSDPGDPAEEMEEDGNGANEVVEEEGDHEEEMQAVPAPDDEKKEEDQRENVAGDVNGGDGDGKDRGDHDQGQEVKEEVQRALSDEEFKYDHLNEDDIAPRKRGKSSSSV